ncbi:histidine phosphatase family protein [Anatilimnocola sp. NA78]|uniref:histidine phosphatase family protein n=1 Tax=Anatilimnocola sp. NA78 TaxID=3415683 RepID=UPI003CE48021
MVRILLIRSAATDFDEQGRIKGTLDLPLSDVGTAQAVRLVAELQQVAIDYFYSSTCRCAVETATQLAHSRKLKVKQLADFQNVDHGLWHGKLVDELKHTQPRVYRQLQEHPETVCPPEGEPVGMAQARVRVGIDRLLRKHRTGTIALVLPEPLFSLARNVITPGELGDLWKAECQCGGWQLLDLANDDVRRVVLAHTSAAVLPVAGGAA